MEYYRDPFDKYEGLRQKAEARIPHQSGFLYQLPEDPVELANEFQVHHAELEIQNEELQRAQQELAEIHAEYVDLYYDFAPCGYVTLSPYGMITRINLTAISLLDSNKKSLKSIPFSRFLDSESEAIYYQALQQTQKSDEKQSIELKLNRENGTSIWCWAEIRADCTETGRVIQRRMVLVDITAKKEAEAALKNSEARFRSMMETMKDAVYIASPDFRIEYMNPKMIERTGRDATGEPCYQAIYGHDSPCPWCVAKQVEQGETVEYEMADPKDNRHYWMSISPLYPAEGGAVSKLIVFRDITEFKMMEAQIRQSKKMESISTLAGGIAHDFNNLLFIVLANAELARDNISENAKICKFIHEIENSVKRGAAIVNNLLNFSRNTLLNFTRVDLIPIVEETIQFVRSTFICQRIEIRARLPEKGITMHADPCRIRQAILNLCANACQAMEESGGVLDIRVQEATLDKADIRIYPDLKAGNYVRITIRDTGPGIPPPILDRIFDPYFTTKEVGKGSGMGLAVVHGIVKSHNGAVSVESQPEEGATFTLLFPVAGQ